MRTLPFAYRAKQVLPPFLMSYASKALQWLRRNQDWTEIEFDIVHLLAPKEKAAIDVGANMGEYTVALSKLCTRVFAVEPDAGMAASIEELSLPNVITMKEALSDSNRTTILHVPIVGGSRQVALATIEPGQHFQNVIDQQVTTSTLNQFQNDDIGFVKIDVEGHEVEVIEGGIDLFKKQKPTVLVEIEERHRPNAIKTVADIFTSLGYFGFFIFEKRTYSIAELEPYMTDHKQTMKLSDRRDWSYTNNFIFVHEAARMSEIRSAVDVFLKGKWH